MTPLERREYWLKSYKKDEKEKEIITTGPVKSKIE